MTEVRMVNEPILVFIIGTHPDFDGESRIDSMDMGKTQFFQLVIGTKMGMKMGTYIAVSIPSFPYLHFKLLKHL